MVNIVLFFKMIDDVIEVHVLRIGKRNDDAVYKSLGIL